MVKAVLDALNGKPFNIRHIAVFPAYAGVNPMRARGAEACTRIPRVCGGEPTRSIIDLSNSLYSPRMRG